MQALQGLGEMGVGLNVLLNNAGSATFGAGGRLDAADHGVSVFDRTSEFRLCIADGPCADRRSCWQLRLTFARRGS